MKERIYRISAGIPRTIALLSDLHAEDGSRAIKIIGRRRPDLIAVTGDLFLGYKAGEGDDLTDLQPQVIPFLRSCVELAPTYVSLGNHEWMLSPADFHVLKSTGARLLDNEWIRDEHTGLLIGGLTSAMVMDYRRFRQKYDPKIRYPEERRHIDGVLLHPEAGWLQKFEQQQGYKILLCHHPEYWSLKPPMLRDHPIDLVLAGHAHGGQIRLFGHGLFSPGQGILPPFTRGVFPLLQEAFLKARTGSWLSPQGCQTPPPAPSPASSIRGKSSRSICIELSTDISKHVRMKTKKPLFNSFEFR